MIFGRFVAGELLGAVGRQRLARQAARSRRTTNSMICSPDAASARRRRRIFRARRDGEATTASDLLGHLNPETTIMSFLRSTMRT